MRIRHFSISLYRSIGIIIVLYHLVVVFNMVFTVVLHGESQHYGFNLIFLKFLQENLGFFVLGAALYFLAEKLAEFTVRNIKDE